MKIILKLKYNTLFVLILILLFIPLHSFSKGKIYGTSKTISKEYPKYEKCLLKKIEENIKDDEKDGYKCIYKRQSKGKDVVIFQPSNACQRSYKCKRAIQ